MNKLEEVDEIDPKKNNNMFYEKLVGTLKKIKAYNLMIYGNEEGHIKNQPVLHGLPNPELKAKLEVDDFKIKLALMKSLRPRIRRK